MTSDSIKKITLQALVAACYIVLTLITYPISFLGIQFRVAELLLILCFFKKDYIVGVSLGCIIVNLTSAIGLVDAGVGGLATLLSCLIIWISPFLLPSLLVTILINGFLVGWELFFFLHEPFWISVGFVSLGEVVVLFVGYVIMIIFKYKNKLRMAKKPYGDIDFKW